jgi:hypothetical protein
MLYVFNKSDARLSSVTKGGKLISLANGPALNQGNAVLSSISAVVQNGAVHINALFSSGMQSVSWTIYGNGWCRLNYSYSLNGSYDYYGVNFDYPEAKASALQWLGRGPYHVWKNRLKGVTYNVWRTVYNDGIAGENWVYPEFKGYFADMYWARLVTSEDTLNFIFDDQKTFYRNFTAGLGTTPVNATASFPSGAISFLQGIAPIGNKFHVANQTGPQGQQNTVNGSSAATVFMYFGNPQPVTRTLQNNTKNIVTSALEIHAAAGQGPRIRFCAPDGAAAVTISNIFGRVVCTVTKGLSMAGWQTIDAGTLPSGVYVVRLSINGNTVAAQKLYSLK